MLILHNNYMEISILIFAVNISNLLSYRSLYSYTGVYIFDVEGKTFYNIGRRLTEGGRSLGIRRDIFSNK